MPATFENTRDRVFPIAAVDSRQETGGSFLASAGKLTTSLRLSPLTGDGSSRLSHVGLCMQRRASTRWIPLYLVLQVPSLAHGWLSRYQNNYMMIH
jgi:hypothetical protein